MLAQLEIVGFIVTDPNSLKRLIVIISSCLCAILQMLQHMSIPVILYDEDYVRLPSGKVDKAQDGTRTVSTREIFKGGVAKHH